jgi:methionyl-tRNA formyltransferase
MNIVFFGTPDFSVVSLRRLIEERKHPILGVVTASDKPVGRGRRPAAPPVKQYARQADLPVLQPPKLRAPEFLADLSQWGADCFVVVAFRILPEEIIAMPRYGTINVHASLLPAYRGAAPIRRALFNGETTTGVTTFMIRKKVDTGDILLAREIAIGPEETHGELAARLALTGAELLMETLDKMERKEVSPQRQDDTLATKAPKITADDRIIDWTRSAQHIANRVRGLAPAPGAICRIRDLQVKILRCRPAATPLPHDSRKPGETIAIDPKQGVIVAAGEGALVLTEIQPAGKRPMTGAEFTRGYRVSPGEIWS